MVESDSGVHAWNTNGSFSDDVLAFIAAAVHWNFSDTSVALAEESRVLLHAFCFASRLPDDTGKYFIVPLLEQPAEFSRTHLSERFLEIIFFI